MVKITVHIPARLHRALEEVARTEKMPRAEVVRKVLEAYPELGEESLPISAGPGDDEDLSGADPEDRLLAEWGRN